MHCCPRLMGVTASFCEITEAADWSPTAMAVSSMYQASLGGATESSESAGTVQAEVLRVLLHGSTGPGRRSRIARKGLG